MRNPDGDCKWVERNGEWHVVAYTDGSTFYPTSTRFAHSGYGVYYAKDSKANFSAPLNAYRQTTFRAELRAVVHVLSTAVDYTLIKTDCKSVADMSSKLLAMGA